MAVASMHEFHAKLAIRKTMGVRREEFIDFMSFRANTRPMIAEIWGPLVGLKEEWAAQGASEGEIDMSAFPYRQPLLSGMGVSTGFFGGQKPQILEETDEHVIGIDAYGRHVKLIKNSASLPLPMDYPVRGWDDWLRLKPHYQFEEARFAKDWLATAKQRQAEGYVLCIGIPGAFDEPRQLMGEEELCIAYYSEPDLIMDMLGTIGDTVCRLLERVTESIAIDMLRVHEDLAGKSGPLPGPAQIRQFMAPYYRRAWDIAAAHGTRLFDMDTDGNVDAVLDDFIAAGINVMHPFECAAGMDIVKVREKYGKKLAFMGGLEKHVLRRSLEEIDAELEYKIPPMVHTGGCLLGLDHRIPNGTPLAHYRHYIAKAWQIMNREAERLNA
jgi:hypothetical protein